MAKATTVLLVVLGITALSIPVVWQSTVIQRVRQRCADTERQRAAAQDQLERLRSENERLRQSRVPVPSQPNSSQLGEVLRLRGQMGVVRQQITEKDQQLKAAQARLQESMDRAAKWGETGAVLTAMEAAELRNLSVSARTKLLRDAMAALRDIAQTNQTGFALRLAQVPPEAQALLQSLQPESGLEIVYHGPLNDLQNPGRTIVIRQRESEEWPDGTFSRVYGFGDGHVEIHKRADGKSDD